MNWFITLLTDQSVAHTLLIISLVISSGLALGEIPFFKIKLGIAGVLFSGLAFGHFAITIDPHIMHFLREFGLILFVYAIGLQVGPGFVNSFLQNGIRLNILAASIVILGAVITVAISYFGHIKIPIAVGLFSGATTNTPSLAAAQEILGGMPSIDSETLKHPGLGYAVAYPFGIIGIIFTMLLTKLLFKVNVDSEAESFRTLQKENANRPIWIDLTINNTNLNSLTVDQIPFFKTMDVVVTRILHDGEVHVINNKTQLYIGDSIRLVGEKMKLDELKMLIGSESEFNLKEISANLLSKRFVVTNKEAVGKSISELRALYAVTIPRLHRPEVELTPSGSVHIHFGDELHVVGSKESLKQIEKILGNSLEKLSHPQIVPIFIGITLGVILGSWPFFIPGIPSAIKLGLAGGPLIIAIILSRIGNWGTMTWHLPKSSNIILKDIGIVLFLACVGLHSGDQFVNTLINGDGLYWMACSILITLLPLLIVAFVAKGIYKLNFLSVCGLLAGSMTDPPALAFANSFSNSSAVSIAYATVYPLVMILRIISAQLIILFFIS
ncbi:MAG: putative transporter [Methylococcales bacterium]|nr:putative transporter [Methylococcales bacterium]